MPRGIPRTDPDRLNYRQATELAERIRGCASVLVEVFHVAQGVYILNIFELAPKGAFLGTFHNTDQWDRFHRQADKPGVYAGEREVLAQLIREHHRTYVTGGGV